MNKTRFFFFGILGILMQISLSQAIGTRGSTEIIILIDQVISKNFAEYKEIERLFADNGASLKDAFRRLDLGHQDLLGALGVPYSDWLNLNSQALVEEFENTSWSIDNDLELEEKFDRIADHGIRFSRSENQFIFRMDFMHFSSVEDVSELAQAYALAFFLSHKGVPMQVDQLAKYIQIALKYQDMSEGVEKAH